MDKMNCILRPVLRMQLFSLQHHCKEANDDGEQGRTFHEGGSKDHVTPDVIDRFRLACDGFEGTFTDLADTHTGTDDGY